MSETEPKPQPNVMTIYLSTAYKELIETLRAKADTRSVSETIRLSLRRLAEEHGVDTSNLGPE